MIDETGKVTFNEQEQTELNRVIEERLARERGKFENHDDMKAIVEELQAFGYKGTPKEIREVIKTQREEALKQTELAALEAQAKADGTTPALLAKIDKLEKQLSELAGERNVSKQAEDAKRAADESWNAQVAEMATAYPDVDLAELPKDPKFAKFVKGKNLPLKEIYEDFVEFIGAAEAETIAKVKSKETRSTGSGKGASSPGGSHGLTKDQMDLVDDWNRSNPKMKMSYKQFADRLQR